MFPAGEQQLGETAITSHLFTAIPKAGCRRRDSEEHQTEERETHNSIAS